MRDDPWGDVDDVKELVSQAGGELFLYDGDAHLFTDSSLDAYDPAAAGLVMKRTLAFLDTLS
jgi:dienelactone hydrolase